MRPLGLCARPSPGFTADISSRTRGRCNNQYKHAIAWHTCLHNRPADIRATAVRHKSDAPGADHHAPSPQQERLRTNSHPAPNTVGQGAASDLLAAHAHPFCSFHIRESHNVIRIPKWPDEMRHPTRWPTKRRSQPIHLVLSGHSQHSSTGAMKK